MKTAIVVGANGFLGSALVNALIFESINVVAVYHSNKNNINPKAQAITTNELFEQNPIADCLFYAVGNYACVHSELIEINNQLYGYINKFPMLKWVYVSSTNIYGVHGNAISENSSFNCPSLYALSKIAGEFLVSSLNNFSIIRFTYLYGPGITNSSFLPTIISNAKLKGSISLSGRGSRLQDYLYIDDAVECCIKAGLINGKETYLAASGLSISNTDVANEIKKYINCEIVYEGVNTAPSFQFDPHLTFEKLKWRPKTSFQEGMNQMLK